MSSGMISRAKGSGGDKPGRSGFWPAITEHSESPPAEGTGLIWLQEKLPSWRYYVEQARESMQG